MNYWFLYHLDNGALYGAPYLGETEEWTNIPLGCGVIGPIPSGNDKAKDASDNPDFYTIQNGALVPASDIDQRRAEKEAERQRQNSMPSEIDKIKAESAKSSADFQSFMDYFFTRYPEA